MCEVLMEIMKKDIDKKVADAQIEGFIKGFTESFTESFDLMPNYDTVLLIADNAKECGDADMAVEYYWLASRMCPVRFVPLYGLFRLYEELNQLDKMEKVGIVIISKPMKVSSFKVREIKSYVRSKLNAL